MGSIERKMRNMITKLNELVERKCVFRLEKKQTLIQNNKNISVEIQSQSYEMLIHLLIIMI